MEKERRREKRRKRLLLKEGVWTLFPSDAFEEFSPVDDSGSCGDSWGDLLGDSCGLPECVPAVSSGVPVVTVVPSFFTFDGKLCCRALIVRLWKRSL